MGTHPIFESDFDCLTESMRFKNVHRLAGISLASAVGLGAVGQHKVKHQVSLLPLVGVVHGAIRDLSTANCVHIRLWDASVLYSSVYYGIPKFNSRRLCEKDDAIWWQCLHSRMAIPCTVIVPLVLNKRSSTRS